MFRSQCPWSLGVDSGSTKLRALASLHRPQPAFPTKWIKARNPVTLLEFPPLNNNLWLFPEFCSALYIKSNGITDGTVLNSQTIQLSAQWSSPKRSSVHKTLNTQAPKRLFIFRISFISFLNDLTQCYVFTACKLSPLLLVNRQLPQIALSTTTNRHVQDRPHVVQRFRQVPAETTERQQSHIRPQVYSWSHISPLSSDLSTQPSKQLFTSPAQWQCPLALEKATGLRG